MPFHHNLTIASRLDVSLLFHQQEGSQPTLMMTVQNDNKFIRKR